MTDMTKQEFQCMTSLYELTNMAAMAVELQEKQASVEEAIQAMQSRYLGSQHNLYCQRFKNSSAKIQTAIRKFQAAIGGELLFQLVNADELLSIEDFCDACELDIEAIDQLADDYDPDSEFLGICSWSIVTCVTNHIGNAISDSPLCKCVRAAIKPLQPRLQQGRNCIIEVTL